MERGKGDMVIDATFLLCDLTREVTRMLRSQNGRLGVR